MNLSKNLAQRHAEDSATAFDRIPARWPGIWKENRVHKTIVFIVLAVHVCLLAHHARVHSPGWDEVGHFGSGMVHVQTGVFDLYRVNPPLVRTWACLAPYLSGMTSQLTPSEVYSESGRRAEFWSGEQLMNRYGTAYMSYLSLARYMCIPFSLLGAFAIHDLSMFIYGRPAAILGVILWCFSPLVIGHGSMITPDVPAAAMACLTINMLTRWLVRLSWTGASLVGVILGVAILCKLTNLILIPIICLTAGFCAYLMSPRAVRRKVIMQLVCVGIVAIYVINMGYGFERSLTRLGDFRFISELFAGELEEGERYGNRFKGTVWAEIPVPLPANILQGIDVQRRDFQNGMMSYLGGRWQSRGWWYYYLYGFGVKEPVGTLALLCLAAGIFRSLPRRTRISTLMFVLIPALSVTTFVSSQTGFNHHLRYLLPAFPFFYVFAAGVAASTTDRRLEQGALVCAVLVVLSATMCAPHSISFFNLAVGGPLKGPAYLHNSNVDWGQDALFLRDWLREHPEARPIQVDFCGGFSPASLHGWPEDVAFRRVDKNDVKLLMNGQPPMPWYAVSVGHIYDPPHPYDRYASFRPVNRDASVGYSIRIYRRE